MDFQKKEREEIFVRLYKTYGEDMYRYALSILKNEADAEDAVQNAMIRLYEHLDTVMQIEEGKENAYVMTIMRNVAYNLYNKNKSSVNLHKDIDITEEIEFVDYEAAQNLVYYIKEEEEESALMLCLKEINEDYSHIIMLYYYEGYSLKEIADLYQIAEATATVRLHRARKAVERELRKKGYYEKLRKERGEEKE